MAEIRLGEAISAGMERTERMLFQPVNRRKWGLLAVAGMLTLVGEGGILPPVEFDPSNWPSLPDGLEWLRVHMVAFLVWGSVLAVVLCAIYMTFRWLNARGQFMLFEHVVNDTLEVKGAWRRHRELGNSFYWFRIKWDLLLFNVLLVIGLVAGALEWPDLKPALNHFAR